MELIDSKYTREKYKKLGMEFSDWQKATIIWNKPMPLPVCLNALKKLAGETSDIELKKQIKERVSYEERLLACITQNPNTDYIYIVKDIKEECDYGAFYMFDTAFEHARKYIKEETEMCIKKIQIVKGTEIPKYKLYYRWNPNLFPNMEKIEENSYDYSDGEVGNVTISVDGKIRHWWSSESTREEDMVVDVFNKNRFESKFIKLPYVHAAGMIVKYVPTGEIGVLATGKEDWDAFMKRVDNGLYVDYFDKSYEVYSLCDNGYWTHDHLCPFLLEEATIPNDISDAKESAMYQAMKALSSFFSGNQTKVQEQEVIRSTKEYARVVHEETIKEKIECEPTEIWHILH